MRPGLLEFVDPLIPTCKIAQQISPAGQKTRFAADLRFHHDAAIFSIESGDRAGERFFWLRDNLLRDF